MYADLQHRRRITNLLAVSLRNSKSDPIDKRQAGMSVNLLLLFSFCNLQPDNRISTFLRIYGQLTDSFDSERTHLASGPYAVHEAHYNK